MTDPLRGPKLKVERAYTHIQEMNGVMTQFCEANPGTIFTELDPTGTQEMIKLRLTEPLPDLLPIVIAEIIYNLRSALDQSACALAVQNGNTVKDVYFPIADSRNEFETTHYQGKIEKLSPNAIAMIGDIAPYKGGNDLLWLAARLSNIDRHRMLIPMAGMMSGVAFQLEGQPLGTFEHVFSVPRKWQPLDQEAIILKYPAGMKLQGHIEPTLNVSFCDTKGFELQPITAVLTQCHDAVKRVIEIFEHRFFKHT